MTDALTRAQSPSQAEQFTKDLISLVQSLSFVINQKTSDIHPTIVFDKSNLTSDLYQGHIKKIFISNTPTCHCVWETNCSQQGTVFWQTHSLHQNLQMIRFGKLFWLGHDNKLSFQELYMYELCVNVLNILYAAGVRNAIIWSSFIWVGQCIAG